MFKRHERIESFLGKGTFVNGNIKNHGTLRIDGSVEGNIEADWVIVGDSGSVKGDVSAKGIIIGGSIEGNLGAKEIVEIKTKGSVTGEIKTPKLSIAEGGSFEGRSIMPREESKVIELPRVETGSPKDP